MRLSIITISYNSSENTIKLLESLKNQTPSTSLGQADFEVIVVDNNSDDVGKLMNYQTTETNIIYIKNRENTGFSSGCNKGIEEALKRGSEWVILLNNDTWVEPGFIALLGPILASETGIIGLPIDEGRETISHGGVLRWLRPTLSYGHGMINSDNQVGSGDNDAQNRYAIGGGMGIHDSVFKKIGYFDERYFLYFEDADFSLRAKMAGIIFSFPDKPIIHHSVSASTKKLGSPLLLRYHYRNALYFNFKNGPWYIKLLVKPWSWFVAGKQIFKIAVGRNREESKAIFAGIIDFYRNRMGKIKTGT